MPYKDPTKKKDNYRLYVQRMKLNPAWIISQRIRLRKYKTPDKNREQFQRIKRDPDKYEKHLQRARLWQKCEKAKAAHRAYKKAHRKEESAQERKRYMNNLEEFREKSRMKYAKYAQRKASDYRERSRRWRKNNPEKRNHLSKRHRARKLNATGRHTLQQWIWRVQYYGWRCFYCTKPLNSQTLTKDHRIALSNGGTDFSSNLVPACKRCNSSKGHRRKTPRSIFIGSKP